MPTAASESEIRYNLLRVKTDFKRNAQLYHPFGTYAKFSNELIFPNFLSPNTHAWLLHYSMVQVLILMLLLYIYLRFINLQILSQQCENRFYIKKYNRLIHFTIYMFMNTTCTTINYLS